MTKTVETKKIERLAVNITEASEMLGISERMIFKLTQSGKIPSKKIGSRVIYPIDGLRSFVNETGMAGGE